MTILALDLGQKLGWVKGPAGALPVKAGTIELRDTAKLGPFLRSADDPLRDLLEGVTAVAVEKPNTAGNSAYMAVRKLMGLLGHTHYWASFYGVSVTEISVMSGKLSLAGSGRAQKDDMIRASAALGFPVTDEHQADAHGIWRVFVHGAPETKSAREKREAAERRAAREAAKTGGLL